MLLRFEAGEVMRLVRTELEIRWGNGVAINILKLVNVVSLVRMESEVEDESLRVGVGVYGGM